jgi:hypothetical protein
MTTRWLYGTLRNWCTRRRLYTAMPQSVRIRRERGGHPLASEIPQHGQRFEGFCFQPRCVSTYLSLPPRLSYTRFGTDIALESHCWRGAQLSFAILREMCCIAPRFLHSMHNDENFTFFPSTPPTTSAKHQSPCPPPISYPQCMCVCMNEKHSRENSP